MVSDLLNPSRVDNSSNFFKKSVLALIPKICFLFKNFDTTPSRVFENISM
jgi:signal transduction histidine kinase